MESVWFKCELADEIMQNPNFIEQSQNVVIDVISGRLEITKLVENMAGVLTNKEVDNREKGMKFFTKILKEIPESYLTEMQIKFISKFYTDRLKDNHRVIPPVLEGYLAIINMKNYSIQFCGEFFTTLFREVPCQSQVRQDRYHIYLIVQTLLNRNIECCGLEILQVGSLIVPLVQVQVLKLLLRKAVVILLLLAGEPSFCGNICFRSYPDMKTLGPDFVYGVISSIEGERDPRNLLFLFNFLPNFLSHIPLGHLTEEMFDVISCYYPIDFHPSPNDPAPVTRQDLASALIPCLCAVPEFAEYCLVLLVEKLDSSLKVAKLDSLMLLAESCKTFTPASYSPFLKTLWSSINREINNKTDNELKMAAHQALSALVAKLSTTANSDQEFENFLKGIIISNQTALAGASTVSQFVQAAKVLLTTANASKESCYIVTKTMIPALVAYYEFKTTPKLQTTTLEFVGDLYEMAMHWNIAGEIEAQIVEIPQLCLLAVSQPSKEYQIAGFRTLVRAIDSLKTDLVVPFVEVLIYNVQQSNDSDLLKVSVETVHAIARNNPEIIMDLVVKGKCDLDNLIEDKSSLKKRLNLLSSLASIDDFTKVIIEEMLKIMPINYESALKVVEALNHSMSDTSLYSQEKITQIASDHGLIESVMSWLLGEIQTGDEEILDHGFSLIANTISCLPALKQKNILSKYSSDLFKQCETNERIFSIVESLYSSVHQSVDDSSIEEAMTLSLNLSLNSDNVSIRVKACALIAHVLNKAEYGQRFEILYEKLKEYLSSCKQDDMTKCPRLIELYGWITKALVLRSCDHFLFWLQKILVAITNEEFCKSGAEAIRLVVTEFPDHLNARQHCRISPFYMQRMFQSFASITGKIGPLSQNVKESYLLSWAYILGKTPKIVLNNEVDKVSPLVIEALDYENSDLLLVMLDVMCHYVQAKHATIAQSLQSILPRLVKLSSYVKSMDVRIKSLQCLFEIANAYPTAILLPYKQDVLLDLAPSLDDKKRLVRKVAVQARTRWFLVGAPGESKEN